MQVNAHREFWLWMTAFAVLTGTTLVLGGLAIGRGGWWLLVPLVWFAAALIALEWNRKRRQSATLAWWATTRPDQ